MRSIYKSKSLQFKLTQGSIISNCVAQDYSDAKVWGLIITARCDLYNDFKVSTVHYLPVVSLDDWLKRNFIDYRRDRFLDKSKTKILNWIDKNYPEIKDILDSAFCDKNTVVGLMKDKKANPDIIKICETYFAYLEGTDIDNEITGASKSDDFLENCADNKIQHIHLLEGWDPSIPYAAVLLREIHQITISVANKLNTGFWVENPDEDFFLKNQFRKPDKDNLLVSDIVAELNSPYIEHLMQRFTNNFIRIGIDSIDQQDLINRYTL